jgi:hypothetical protein
MHNYNATTWEKEGGGQSAGHPRHPSETLKNQKQNNHEKSCPETSVLDVNYSQT